MKLKQKIYIVILAKEDNLIELQTTINNLNKNNCTTEDYIVAIKDNYSEMKQYCIENEIRYYEYKELIDVYYKLPKSLEFDYISFINEGDEYSNKFKNILKDKIKNTDNSKIFICDVNNRMQTYSLNKTLNKCGTEIKIEERPKKVWLQLKSAFINKKILEKIEPPTEKIHYYIEQNLITKLILLSGGYTILKNMKLTTRTNIRGFYK